LLGHAPFAPFAPSWDLLKSFVFASSLALGCVKASPWQLQPSPCRSRTAGQQEGQSSGQPRDRIHTRCRSAHSCRCWCDRSLMLISGQDLKREGQGTALYPESRPHRTVEGRLWLAHLRGDCVWAVPNPLFYRTAEKGFISLCSREILVVIVWPSGLRRAVQVRIYFCGRRFEPCSDQCIFFCWDDEQWANKSKTRR
jgi:hypothetical protein